MIMANIKNLQAPRSTEEARRRGRAGGIASGKARREKRTMREFAEILGQELVEMPMPDGTKREMTLAEATVFSQYRQATTKGNTKAAIFLATLRGEMEQKVAVTTTTPPIVVEDKDQAERLAKLFEHNGEE